MNRKNLLIILVLMFVCLIIGISDANALTFDSKVNLLMTKEEYEACINDPEQSQYCEKPANSFASVIEDIPCVLQNTKNEHTYKLIKQIFDVIKIIIPIIIIVLVSIDMVKAISAGDEKIMKKAQGDAIKRIIIGVIVFLVPTIVFALLELIGSNAGTCGLS